MARTATTARATNSLSVSTGETAGVRCRNPLTRPKGNANFAWVQHFIHHLAPHGMAGLNAVRMDLTNGSMSSNRSRVHSTSSFFLHPSNFDAALPGQLFYSTPIPVCLWFLAKNKAADGKRGFRDRRKRTIFIDARKLGTLIDRVPGYTQALN